VQTNELISAAARFSLEAVSDKSVTVTSSAHTLEFLETYLQYSCADAPKIILLQRISLGSKEDA
jgi:hypothetical protein